MSRLAAEAAHGSTPGHGALRAFWRAVSLVRSTAFGWALGYLLCCFLSGLLGPAGAWSLGRLVSDVELPGSDAALPAAGVAGSAGLLAVLVPVSRLLQDELARRLRLRARGDLLAAVAGVPLLDQVEDPSFHDRLRLAQDAGGTVPMTVVRTGFSLVQATISMGGFALTLASCAAWAVPAGLVCVAPAALAGLATSRRQATVSWQTSSAMRRQLAYAGLLTDLRAAKEIRLWGIGDLLVNRMRDEMGAIDARERRVQYHATLVQCCLAIASLGCALAAILWATHLTIAGRMNSGQLTELVAALGGLEAAAGLVVRSATTAYTGLLSFAHYGHVLDFARAQATESRGDASIQAELRNGRFRPAGRTPVPPLRHAIQLHAVSYGYPGRTNVLSACTLVIPAGATVALVGANGAGKSTLVKLLCGMYRPSAGTIYWDGLDLSACDLASLRRRISTVFQDFVQYEMSARDNIGFGDTHQMASLAALRRAAQSAGIDEDLAALPRGYDTVLSRALRSSADERANTSGSALSGGQWQRVAIARALLRDQADLLILDEASSGLDALAEARLQQQLADRAQGRTTLIVSHRLATTRDADLIAVLSGGAVAEQGTHAQLMARGGLYAELFDTQAAAYQPVPVITTARGEADQ